MKVANKLILVAGALASVDAAKLQAQSKLTSQSQAMIDAEESITVQTESGIEALSESFLEADAQQEVKMIAQQEAQLQEENTMRESENNKLIKDIGSLIPKEYKSTAHTEKSQKIVDDSNHKIYDTVKSVNATITDADRLINELAFKKIHEKEAAELVQKPKAPVSKQLLEQKADIRIKTQPDYLEHTRYGEGNHPSTNEKPIPDHFAQPLVITNAKDEHDFTPPYKDHRPARVFKQGEEIIAQHQPIQSLAATGPSATHQVLHAGLLAQKEVKSKKKDEEKKEAPFPIASSVNQGKTQVAAVNEMMRMPKHKPEEKKAKALVQKKGDEKVEAPFPIASSVNQGKTQVAAVNEMMRMPKHKPEEKKALVQKKGDDKKEGPPFQIASSVNQGKTQVAAVNEMMRMPKHKPEEKKSLVQKKGDEEKKEAPFQIASSVNQGKTQVAAVNEMMRMPKHKPEEKKAKALVQKKGDDKKDEAPFPIASSVNQGKTQVAAVNEMMRMPKHKPAEKKALVQAKTLGQPDPLEHTRYGEGNHPSTNEKPIPDVFVKPLVITNVKDEHDFTPPYKDHRPPKVFNPEIHLAAAKNLQQVKVQPDPLEHTRYGEGNHPSTNEKPIPAVFVKPLVITNVKDEHDFTPPYKDHRPPKVFNPEIHLASAKQTVPLNKSKQQQAGIKSLQQLQTQPDPLEHTRYGEGNHPSTNEKPIPAVFVKPLVITNVKDEHDFTPPYKDHRPPKVFDPEIHLAAAKGKDLKKPAAQSNVQKKQDAPTETVDSKKKEIDIKIVPVVPKKGTPTELTVSQDFHKIAPTPVQMSIGMQIENFFGHLFHLW